MSMSDPLGDMLTRIRNGQSAGKAVVMAPFARFRALVLDVLQSEGYIRGYKVETDEDGHRQLVIELKYEDGKGVIRKIQRVSTPGRRVYKKINDLDRYYNGLGIRILSTSRGVLADHQAHNENVGGEVLCQVF